MSKVKITDISSAGQPSGRVPISDGSGNVAWGAGGGGGGSVEVLLNGVSVVAVAAALNFTGDGVDVVENPSGTAEVTISGGGDGGSRESSWYLGQGERRFLIRATSVGGAGGNIQNTLGATPTNDFWWGAGTGTRTAVFDFQTPRVVTGLSASQNNNTANGTWTISGSNDNTTWTDIITDYVQGGTPYGPLGIGANFIYAREFYNTVAYRYYRLSLNAGSSTSTSPYVQQYIFKVEGSLGGSGSSVAYLNVPNFRPGNATFFGSGNFGGRAVLVSDDCEITHISGYCATANASSVVRPAIYSKNPTTGAPDTLLASGPQLTGVPQGVVDLPLTAPYHATAGEEIYIGWQVLTSNLSMATVTAHATFFFSASGSLPSTAPSATYDSGGSMCLFMKATLSRVNGGSGSSYERSRAIPKIANFTLQNANSGILSDGSKNTGIVLDSVNSTVGIRMIRANGAPPALPYTIISRSQPLGANGNSYPAAIILRNSTNGRLIIFGCYNYTQELVQQWSSYTSFNANILSPAYVWTAGAPLWRKVEVTSTNITFYISVDGENWYPVATTTMAAYLNAIDEIGMGMFVSGGVAKSVFQSWEVF